MLLKRPFSFSDASTNVALPSFGGTPAAALALFRLRRVQSHLYVGLYQRSAWKANENAWTFIWSEYAKLQEWFETSLSKVDPVAARVVELEHNFWCVYLLTSSPRCPVRDAHAEGIKARHAARLPQLLKDEAVRPFYAGLMKNQMGQ